ncbi:M20/M25/M40 family metallo-hydrolase [Motilibacter aurantiacus]|uniref:M20/M25/M40 family metallo-hydrolase n=1 Tax=Motilibacter aurantiacus TaxID=2714955 RepID=UPI001408A403|nr:M20/M25/M40 family metallo-hydrolase [Motilibacter aurantiacus]
MQPDDAPGAASRRAFLTRSAAVAAGLVGTQLPGQAAHADEPDPELPWSATVDWPDGPGKRIRPQKPDNDLRDLLAEIDPARIEAIVRKLVSFGTRHTLSAQDDPVRGIGAARDWIFAELSSYAAASGGRMTVETQSYLQQPASRIPTPTVISNVIATLRGSRQPERVYVVSGHYDSRVTDVLDATSDSPGANDDASGVAAVMEMARVLATKDPDATILFVAVAGEEQNLYGGRYMASRLRAANVDVQAMLNNDIIGSSTGDDGKRERYTVRCFVQGIPPNESASRASTRRSIGGENDSPARELGRFIAEVAQNKSTGMSVRLIYRLDRYLRGGDHTAFLEQGYPAVRFTEPNEDFAHQHQDLRTENGVVYGDLPEFCDWDYIARVARVNLASLWSLSQAPGMPANVRVITSTLTNDTVLTWALDGSGLTEGYEVVWRPTDEPLWTHAIEVGLVNRATIDLSKDNVVFGVRAIGRKGLRSPAVFPFP